MFPMLCDEMKGLLPEAYFGGEVVPRYLKIESDGPSSLECVVACIRTIGTGSNACGYIDDQGIHFHLPDDECIRVDLSKEFVFLSQPNAIDGSDPSAWQVFFFLMEPTRKALFIGRGRAILLEKTEQTLSLCRGLDRLWAQERFLATRIEMVESDEAREKGLAHLLRIYEHETRGHSTEMWAFWDTFGMHLMERNLALNVQVIS